MKKRKYFDRIRKLMPLGGAVLVRLLIATPSNAWKFHANGFLHLNKEDMQDTKLLLKWGLIEVCKETMRFTHGEPIVDNYAKLTEKGLEYVKHHGIDVQQALCAASE